MKANQMGRWPVLERDPREIVSNVNWLTRFVNLMQKTVPNPGGLGNKRSPRSSTSWRDYTSAKKGERQMPTPVDQAREYLEKLEADRRNALQVSEQKAEEAKLIKARQEGFRAAMEIIGIVTSVGDAESCNAKAPAAQRIRRPIRQIILRELSFSGRAMTATQIAKAIDYNPNRSTTALSRLEATGQVIRHGADRWTIAIGAMAQLNEHAITSGNGKSL